MARVCAGDRFGRLVVISEDESTINVLNTCHKKFLCQCDCGRTKIIRSANLTRSKTPTRSCGCLIGVKHIKHGDYKTRLYHIWVGMRHRCFAPSDKYYHNYGERGIVVCDEWNEDYLNFKEWALTNGYNDELTIERIDVNGNYEPSNCCWIPRAEQPKNTRISRRYTYNGQTKTLRDWAVSLGGSPDLVKERIKRGWDIEKAITTPPIRSENEERS